MSETRNTYRSFVAKPLEERPLEERAGDVRIILKYLIENWVVEIGGARNFV
jgi:hypothetical protein